jgi:hypothetical protein
VQVAPALNAVIVVTKGVDSDIVPEAGEALPLVQVTLTGTLAALFGTKSLFTVSVVTRAVFVIVQVPEPDGAPLIVPLQVPLEV